MLKPLQRVLMVIVSSAIYFAAAAALRGGIAPFLSDPALRALAIAFLAVVIASVFAGGNISPGIKEDRNNRWVLIAFGVLGLASGFVPPLTDRLNIWCIGGETTRWAGVILYLLGAVLRLWPVVVLGNRFSGLVAIQPGHTLVTTGIYRRIRHPSYLGLLINALGWSLAFRSTIGILPIVALLVPLLARIRSEERLLAGQFGEEYEAYRARTARLLPGVW